jgi:hypothetical protein
MSQESGVNFVACYVVRVAHDTSFRLSEGNVVTGANGEISPPRMQSHG